MDALNKLGLVALWLVPMDSLGGLLLLSHIIILSIIINIMSIINMDASMSMQHTNTLTNK